MREWPLQTSLFGHDLSHATAAGADNTTASQLQPHRSRSLQSWASSHGPRSVGCAGSAEASAVDGGVLGDERGRAGSAGSLAFDDGVFGDVHANRTTSRW